VISSPNTPLPGSTNGAATPASANETESPSAWRFVTRIALCRRFIFLSRSATGDEAENGCLVHAVMVFRESCEGSTAIEKGAVMVTKKRQAADSGSVIERIVFHCILSLAVASVGAVLFLSVVSTLP
jgi:hypothetical protein